MSESRRAKSERSETKLSVIIPVYNERSTLRELVCRVRDVPVEKEIVIVDDGSTDGSREIVQSFEGTPGVKVLLHPENKGKGAAIQTALPHVEGDIVVIQDADLEYDPQDYPRLMQPILDGSADVVYGSRFGGASRRGLHFWHVLGNRLLTALSNLVTHLALTDMETCYKVFRADVIRRLHLRSRDFRIEPEITAKLAKLGVSICEVPISYQARTYAEGKKISWLDGLKAVGALVRFSLFEDD